VDGSRNGLVEAVTGCLSGEAQKHQERKLSGYPVSGPRIEPGTFRI
jgi:hypothetical protein